MKRCGSPNRRWKRFADRWKREQTRIQRNATEGVPYRFSLTNPKSRSQMIASLSLDLDNKWSYLKTHGDGGWEEFPSYLDAVVPRFLALLDRLGLRITVFVVGQDAALPKNRAALAAIGGAGHEIGNHSFH